MGIRGNKVIQLSDAERLGGSLTPQAPPAASDFGLPRLNAARAAGAAFPRRLEARSCEFTGTPSFRALEFLTRAVSVERSCEGANAELILLFGGRWASYRGADAELLADVLAVLGDSRRAHFLAGMAFANGAAGDGGVS